MFAKKKKPSKDKQKKPSPKKPCAQTKLERALQEVKQLSMEAEDFFHTVSTNLDKKEKEDGN